MSKPLSAMIWALAIIFTAWLSSQGAIEKDNAATMMLVLPVLATLQVSGALKCAPCKRIF